jgi:hypothetical protein
VPPLHDGDREQEHHRDAVRREHLVVALGTEQLVLARRELRAHRERCDAAEHEERRRREDVAEADRPVADVGEPTSDRARTRPRAMQEVDRRHRSDSR